MEKYIPALSDAEIEGLQRIGGNSYEHMLGNDTSEISAWEDSLIKMLKVVRAAKNFRVAVALSAGMAAGQVAIESRCDEDETADVTILATKAAGGSKDELRISGIKSVRSYWARKRYESKMENSKRFWLFRKKGHLRALETFERAEQVTDDAIARLEAHGVQTRSRGMTASSMKVLESAHADAEQLRKVKRQW